MFWAARSFALHPKTNQLSTDNLKTMTKATIYHNPRCSKSRQTLALLQEKGIDPEIVEYLVNPPDQSTIRALLDQLGISASQLIRKKEHKALGLAETDDADELISRMVENPQIIERPIVVTAKGARLGRPPENVLDIF